MAPILTPDREALPFLVVHGAWLWKVVVVVGAVVGAYAWQALRHWRVRRAARRLISTSPATVTTMREGEVVLRGILRLHAAEELGTEHVLRRGQPEPEHIAEMDEVISIEQGGDHVLLQGPVVVVSGTKARSSMRRQVDSADLVDVSKVEVRRPERVRWSIVNTLRDGDEVEAHGVGSLVVQPGESDYRTNASAWQLHGGPIRLCAVKPSALATPVGPLRAVVTVGVAMFAIWTSLQIAGDALEDDVKDREHAADTEGELTALSIAAALPSTRAEALERYAWELERARGPASIRRLMALADLMGRCDLANRALIERQRWPALMDRGRQCGNTDVMLVALMGMGRFAEVADLAAAKAAPWPYLQGASTIAAGRWKDAATHADVMASRWAEADGDDSEMRELKWHGRTQFSCLAELLRWRGGDTRAAGRLRSLASTVGASECRVIATELLPRDERFRVLLDLHGELAGADEDFDTRSVVSSLLWSMGWHEPGMGAGVMSGLRRFETYEDPWLAPHGIAARSESSPDWADALALLALWQSMRGDVEAATQAATSAANLLVTDAPWKVRGLLGGVALHSRDLDAYVDDGFNDGGAAPLTELRRGVDPSTLPEYFVEKECEQDGKRALAQQPVVTAAVSRC